jgi:hypothetical protein
LRAIDRRPDIQRRPLSPSTHGPDSSSDGTTGSEAPYFDITRSNHREWRVWRDGVRMRIEYEDGSLALITGGITVRQFMDPREAPLRKGVPSLPRLGNGLELLTRPSTNELDGPKSYTGMMGEIGNAVYLERQVWTVMLAPAPRKECPLHLAADVETGIILRRLPEDNSEVHELTDFRTGEVISDELFRWDGDGSDRSLDPRRSAPKLRPAICACATVDLRADDVLGHPTFSNSRSSGRHSQQCCSSTLPSYFVSDDPLSRHSSAQGSPARARGTWHHRRACSAGVRADMLEQIDPRRTRRQQLGGAPFETR